MKDDIINCMLDYSIVILLSSKLLLIVGSYLRSLVGLYLAYLAPKPLKTLDSSDECPWIWIRQVGFNISFRWYTYLFLLLASALTCLVVSSWQGGLSSHFTSDTNTVGIFPSRFLLKRSRTPSQVVSAVSVSSNMFTYFLK